MEYILSLQLIEVEETLESTQITSCYSTVGSC